MSNACGSSRCRKRHRAGHSRWRSRPSPGSSRLAAISTMSPRNAKYSRRARSRTTSRKAKPNRRGQAYDGNQQGDPAKLGDVLVKIAGMENPPKQFVAGSDALVVVKPVSKLALRNCVQVGRLVLSRLMVSRLKPMAFLEP